MYMDIANSNALFSFSFNSISSAGLGTSGTSTAGCTISSRLRTMLSLLNGEVVLPSELAGRSCDAGGISAVFSMCSLWATILAAAGSVIWIVEDCDFSASELTGGPQLLDTGCTSVVISTFFSRLADAVVLDEVVFVSILDAADAPESTAVVGSSFFANQW